MKHQKKTELVLGVFVWMVFASILGGGMFAHIIGMVAGFFVAMIADSFIDEYDINRKH